MESKFSDRVARAIEDNRYRGVAMIASPTSLVIDLTTDAPNTSTGGTVASYAGYLPVTVAANTSNWGPAGAPPVNQGSVSFPGPTAATTQDVVGYVIRDQAGQLERVGTLEQPRRPQVGVALVFNPADLGLSAN